MVADRQRGGTIPLPLPPELMEVSMITVNDKYVIQVDAYNFIVCKNDPHTVTDSKTGRTRTEYSAVCYLGSLENALLAIRQLMIRDGLKNADTDLPGALRTVRQITADFKQTIKQVLEEA